MPKKAKTPNEPLKVKVPSKTSDGLRVKVSPETPNGTLKVKIFYGAKDEAEKEYNKFMEKAFKNIEVIENKSFYSFTNGHGPMIGLIVYYIA